MSMPSLDEPFGSRSVAGGFGGGQIGYNWQAYNWVFGLEADAQGGSIHGSSGDTITGFRGPSSWIRFDTSECMEFFGTVRGRVGYSWGRSMLYATAGGAFGETNTRIGMTSAFIGMNNAWFTDAAERSSVWRTGYAVGGGGQYALNSNWSVKVEYQYLNFGSGSLSAREFVGATPWNAFISTTTRYDYHTVRLGVNYKFDGGGTAVYLSPR
jgi:outer membrane immunogenic protein